MIKKILFILLLSISFTSFSQQKEVKKIAVIKELSAAPNPFHNFTEITFTSKEASSIDLTVKNILGRIVFTKKYKTKVGKNSISFEKNKLASGIYIYSIKNKKNMISKRFVIR